MAGLGSMYDYNARFYSQRLGRFMSADTLVLDPGSLCQQWLSVISFDPTMISFPTNPIS
jgi:hypothetical protein